ncbi:MAG: malate/lactate/ureidoglycolate dehydrogenase [Rhodospirillales bacterium]
MNSAAAPVRIDADALTAFLAEVFRAAGCSQGEGQRIAQNLVEANLSGHDSHGVIRTPRYLGWLKTGNLVADRDVSVVSDAGALMILDGGFGFGQTVGPQAVARGIDRAKDLGVAVVALRHAGHLGRIGAFAETAAAENQVSVHFVNVAGSVLVAPFGGAERRMSTAPVAIGVPGAGGAPVILDFATSLVAEGKVLVASKGGKPLPEGSLIGPDGQPSADPAMLYGPSDPAVQPNSRNGAGALVAMGGHKGSGLALMCELLAGALTGSGATGPGYDKIYNGMLSIYMSRDRFGAEDDYARELRRYVDYVKSAKPVAGGGEVLVPGEPEARMRDARRKDGIPLAPDAWAAISGAGRDLGVTPPDPLT